ncbi:MAG: hypothetical protein LIP03_14845 [Bacteroidales bacterium]|nr:hypothetical protein [Bacteroidales bacterium]
MEKKKFEEEIKRQSGLVARIRELAHGVHDGVNQKYDKTHPYWFHLDMVADLVREHGAEACARPEDVAPMLFGAYFHDSIEDARLTYNDVLALARGFFDEERAVMATEIAYALTNEKGRNRAERANEKYYAGIRATPYAPLVKLADRVANYTYSMRGRDMANTAMRGVYASEMPHFIASITVSDGDPRLALPESLLAMIK